MSPEVPTGITLTRAQAAALADVGERLGPQIHDLYDDERCRAPIIRALCAVRGAVEGDGGGLDPFEVDLEFFGSIFGDIRSAELAEVVRSRIRALIAVMVLWRAVDDLSGAGESADLLEVSAIDRPGWRAEVLAYLRARGVEVHLTESGHVTHRDRRIDAR